MTLKVPFDRITIEPGKMGGKPCIRGLRISVENVLSILASYSDRRELFEDYPDLEEDDLPAGARLCRCEPGRPRRDSRPAAELS